jgi:hypothetical protein
MRDGAGYIIQSYRTLVHKPFTEIMDIIKVAMHSNRIISGWVQNFSTLRVDHENPFQIPASGTINDEIVDVRV